MLCLTPWKQSVKVRLINCKRLINRLLGIRSCDWNCKGKDASFAWLTLDPDSSMMSFDQVLGDR